MEQKKRLMTGNEAVARGAWEAGCLVISSYPGTPSTEITENAAKYKEIYAEWAPNEKVALEVGIGSSFIGGRALVAMKHVGLNVAADPLFAAAYTGVGGGLVVISADDPGIHSSQNEQDNRHYGLAAKTPILEPSSSEEARVYTKTAFMLSEKFDIPVLLRLTTRIAHSQSAVNLEERQAKPLTSSYVKNMQKYVLMPENARKRHESLEGRLSAIAQYAESTDLNTVEMNDDAVGLIVSGAVYQYAKEALPNASILKLGMTYPLPRSMIDRFAASVKKLYVVEELDPIIETIVKSWGIAAEGKKFFPRTGEIFTEDIAIELGGEAPYHESKEDLPARPPVMCAGCPHRGLFYILKKLIAKADVLVVGDIGCYTLAANAPLEAMDSCLCMGASIGMAHGIEKAYGAGEMHDMEQACDIERPRERSLRKKPVSVIGESTFLHSGITGLINNVYNQSATTTVILDNSVTAMTGHQHNPASGYNAKGRPSPAVDLERLVRACGVNDVTVVDPANIAATEKVVGEALLADEPSVVIARRPCALLIKTTAARHFYVNEDICTGCGVCMRIGCPALSRIVREDGKLKARIDQSQCVACGLCAGVCGWQSIQQAVLPEAQGGVDHE